MEKGEIEITQGLLEYLFTQQPIKYAGGSYHWISYPNGAYRATKLTKEDVGNALVCKIEKHGDYDLTYERCKGADSTEDE